MPILLGAWVPFSSQNLAVISLLTDLIAMSVFPVLVPGFIRQTQSPRTHNNARLFNECLANHQFSYVGFYLALPTLAVLDLQHEWMSGLMRTFVTISLTFFIIGVFTLGNKDEILKVHNCTTVDCRLDRRTRRKLYGLNLGLSVFSFVVALLFATAPIFPRRHLPSEPAVQQNATPIPHVSMPSKDSGAMTG